MATTKQASRILTFPDEYDSFIPNVTAGDYILDAIRQYGNDIACINAETKEAHTYAEIIDTVKSLAAGLQFKFGLRPRERVAVTLPLCYEYALTTMAINICGGTAVLINPAQTVPELKHAFKLASPIRLCIGTDDFISKFQEVYRPDTATTNAPDFISLSTNNNPQQQNPIVNSTWADLVLVGRGKTVKPFTDLDCKQDEAFIFYSSGTTGLPKGVALTHYNFMVGRKISIEMTKNLPRNPDSVSAVMLPPYHTAGYNTLFESLVMGTKYILITNFTMQKMLQAIQDYKITIMVLAPVIANAMAKFPFEKQYDLSSLFMLRSGSGTVSKTTMQTLQAKFDCLYYQVYGMTESTLATHANFIDYNREGSIGVTRAFCESKVINPETNEALGPNEEGEICVRGGLVMKGYVGNEEATRNTIDAEGWLHTGDLGYYDEDGFFFITDRLKELIKYKGFQVSPTELEQILLTHPSVVDAAVIPVKDEMVGELPRAYVVKQAGSKVTEEELMKFVADQTIQYKHLRGGVFFIDVVPKNSTGKTLRRELVKLTSKL